MGNANLIPLPRDNDWVGLRHALSMVNYMLGRDSSPTFTGLTATNFSVTNLTVAGLSGVLKATAGVVSGSAVHADLGSIGANDHHNQAHVLNGADHTVSGLTAGHVLTALTATTFGFAAPVDLGLPLLTDPGADRILFWDETDNALKWLTMGNSIAITGTTLNTIQNNREIINTLLGVHITLDHTAGAYKLLCDAVVDAMESNAGAAAAQNLSASYDSGNDWWNPWVETVNQSQTTATTNGNMGNVAGVETRYAQTFAFTTAYQCPRVDIYLNAPNGAPTGNITCRLETTSGGLPTGTLMAAGASITRAAATGWVAFDFNSVLQFGIAIPVTTVYAIVIVVDNQADNVYFKWGRNAAGGYAGGQACVSVDGGASWSADVGADMAFKVYLGGNMRLQSIAFAASVQPTTARIVILESDDTIVLNTDITAQVSRDGGTTWATVTLASKGLLDASNSILYGSADISGQPAGTSMKWRIETADEHVIRVRGVSLTWE